MQDHPATTHSCGAGSRAMHTNCRPRSRGDSKQGAKLLALLLGRRLGDEVITSHLLSAPTRCFIIAKGSQDGVLFVKHHHNTQRAREYRGSHDNPTIPITVVMLEESLLTGSWLTAVQAPAKKSAKRAMIVERHLPLSNSEPSPVMFSSCCPLGSGKGIRSQAGPPPVRHSPIPTAVAP